MDERSALAWPATVAAVVADEARRTYPEEACGLLLSDTAGALVAAAPVPNAAEAGERRRRYLLAPGAYRRAEQDARSQGLEVAGVFHSHPDHPAEPSATDLADAWPGWVYVIVPVVSGQPGAPRAWRLRDDRQAFEAVPLHAHV